MATVQMDVNDFFNSISDPLSLQDWDEGFLSGVKDEETRQSLEEDLENAPTPFIRGAWCIDTGIWGDWGNGFIDDVEVTDEGNVTSEYIRKLAHDIGAMAEENGWIREYFDRKERSF